MTDSLREHDARVTAANARVIDTQAAMIRTQEAIITTQRTLIAALEKSLARKRNGTDVAARLAQRFEPRPARRRVTH